MPFPTYFPCRDLLEDILNEKDRYAKERIQNVSLLAAYYIVHFNWGVRVSGRVSGRVRYLKLRGKIAFLTLGLTKRLFLPKMCLVGNDFL
jgi:hypothetical protein